MESLNLASKMCLITAGAMAYLGAQGLRNVKKRLNLDKVGVKQQMYWSVEVV